MQTKSVALGAMMQCLEDFIWEHWERRSFNPTQQNGKPQRVGIDGINLYHGSR